MTSAGLRRADTTKGPPLRILSLDGGGVRGYSMLILLQELMHRTYVEIHGKAPKRHEIPKPADHFDLIAGTGTGGLIAIMLGRLRLDLETCKDVYVRMTRRVFETDKTFAGIPYRSTLFKASKLEDAIRDCVGEYTVSEEEGNDGSIIPQAVSPTRAVPSSPPRRSVSIASRSGSIYTPVAPRSAMNSGRWGDPDALLYDTRENRTKTAVTAVYKGTPKTGNAVFLRSYDSRKEPSPEFNCTIWQAGRATSATGLAFKPIQIGQSVFIDEGAGRYNPAPQVLDEALLNEYPGRDVGVFVSIGTGKRPAGTNNSKSQWWEGFLGGSMGDFAEARRRLIAKIEGCEETHQWMMREHLSQRHVQPDNYYRLNVEVGVGEFGMNEWSRLSDISINTHMYLGKQDVQDMNLNAAGKLAKIHKVKLWQARTNGAAYDNRPPSWQESIQNETPPPSNPMAAELPAEDVPPMSPPYPVGNTLYHSHVTEGDKFAVVGSDEPAWSSKPPYPDDQATNPRHSVERFSYASPVTPQSAPPVHSPNTPPPVPPKTPLSQTEHGPYQPPPIHGESGPYQQPNRPFSAPRPPPPYPDGPPPAVNRATKPEFR